MRRLAPAAIAVLFMTGGIAACGSSSGSSSTTAASATTASSGGSGASTPAGTGASGNEASDVGVTKDSIKIGFVNSATGIAASSFGPASLSAAKARFELENEKGGINGRKIKVVEGDDQSVLTSDLPAVQGLVENDKVFALAVVSPYFFGGYRYAVQKGIPVTSAGIDGAPYGLPGSENLFSAQGSLDPKYKTGVAKGEYLKSKGVTTVGVLGYRDSPSSTGSSKAGAKSAELAGLKTDVNITIPFGSTDFTAAALQFKQAGVDGVIQSMVLSSNIAAIKAIKAAGIKLKGSLIYGAYNQDVLDDADATQTLQGIGLTSGLQPAVANAPATKTMIDALKKYAGWTKPNPSQGQLFAWSAADLMVRGLQEAGQNPTRKSFIENLQKVKDYDMGGLIGGKVNFGPEAAGTYEQGSAGNCFYVAVVTNNTFALDPADGKALCSPGLVPGTEQT
jgi:branched-chain amino acid transport system substrate-binding protein